MANFYEILGIGPKADLEEVRGAYRRLAREFHPDVNPDPRAHEQMATINVAFEVLSDPARRAEYDASIGQAGLREREDKQDYESRPNFVQAQILRRLREHATPVYSAAFEPESNRLVTCSFDNEVVWWNKSAEFPEKRLKLEGGVAGSMQLIGKDQFVAAGGSEQLVTAWQYDNGRINSWRHKTAGWVCSVAPSTDGESVAFGRTDNELQVLRAQDGYVRFRGLTHRDAVTALAWNQDSSWLASGSADATVKIWCGATGNRVERLDQIRSQVSALAFSSDNQWLAVAAVDLSIRVFNLSDMSLKKTFFGHERPIETLAFHPKNWLLASGARDGTIQMWNVRQGLGHGKIEASHQPISSLTFAPDGRHMVAGGLDKVLRVWRLSMSQNVSSS